MKKSLLVLMEVLNIPLETKIQLYLQLLLKINPYQCLYLPKFKKILDQKKKLSIKNLKIYIKFNSKFIKILKVLKTKIEGKIKI